MSLGYLNSFYDTAKSRTNGPQVFGSALKGYNEALASWSSTPPDKIEQFCGQTWLETWAEAGRNYSSSSQLANLQVVTWNDYEEGTEMESGIDNCLSVSSAAVSGANLTWTLSGTGEDRTIDRYRIWSSPATDGQNLTLRYEAMGGASRSVSLSALSLPAGSYKLYVQAVGKPSIRNHMSGAVSYSTSCTSPGAVTVTTPTSGATVTSKVHVVASESSCRSADSMQIYLDNTKVFTQYNTDSIDTYVDANCGSHPFTVKAWYSDGTNQATSYTINVNRANLVSSPVNGATVTSPVRVISTSCSNNTVTATQIYLDDVLAAETSTSTLDKSIAMSAGQHCIVGKGWDSAGNSFQTTRICFTVQ